MSIIEIANHCFDTNVAKTPGAFWASNQSPYTIPILQFLFGDLPPNISTTDKKTLRHSFYLGLCSMGPL